MHVEIVFSFVAGKGHVAGKGQYYFYIDGEQIHHEPFSIPYEKDMEVLTCGKNEIPADGAVANIFVNGK